MSNAAMVCAYRDLFPSSRCLFMYRDFEKVAKSVYRVSMVLPSVRLACILGYLSADFGVRLDNNLTTGVHLCALATTSYLDLRRRGFDISAVRYEDLVERPLDMCRVVLEFCHLPQSLAELAVKAFNVDSQRHSVIAKSVIGQFKEPEMTPKIKMELNGMLKKFKGMPLIGEPGIIEGTLSCQ